VVKSSDLDEFSYNQFFLYVITILYTSLLHTEAIADDCQTRRSRDVSLCAQDGRSRVGTASGRAR
jgi:hypothetical protein